MSGQNVIAEMDRRFMDMEKRFAENRSDIRALQWMIAALIAIIVLLATVFVPLALRADSADRPNSSASAIDRGPQASELPMPSLSREDAEAQPQGSQ